MALKYTITADEHGQLEEGTKGLYTEKDGAYVLDVEGLDDNKALKTSRCLCVFCI